MKNILALSITVFVIIILASGCIGQQQFEETANYKLGLVYVYSSEETYNPNWRVDLGKVLPKVENSLTNVSDGRIQPSIEILGEVKTDVFEWNPAEIGIKLENCLKKIENPDEPNQRVVFENCNVIYDQLPNSVFAVSSTNFASTRKKIEENGKQLLEISEWRIVQLECSECVIETKDETEEINTLFPDDNYESYVETIVKMNSEKTLTSENLFNTNKLEMLKTEIEGNLKIDYNNYDGVFIVFGKLGRPLSTDRHFLEWACSGIHSSIGGYSNLIMSENFLMEPDNYFIDCRSLNPSDEFGSSHYLKVGWHQMVHEVLHRLGAVDIYVTGPMFGIRSDREKALEIDTRADESVMGDDIKSCIDEGGLETDGFICTKNDLEEVYLDRYNKQKMGWEVVEKNSNVEIASQTGPGKIVIKLNHETPETDTRIYVSYIDEYGDKKYRDDGYYAKIEVEDPERNLKEYDTVWYRDSQSWTMLFASIVGEHTVKVSIYNEANNQVAQKTIVFSVPVAEIAT